MTKELFEDLGRFTSKSGNAYFCYFYPNDKIVSAMGPFLSNTVDSTGTAFTLPAESEEEAIKIIKNELIKDKY